MVKQNGALSRLRKKVREREEGRGEVSFSEEQWTAAIQLPGTRSRSLNWPRILIIY